MYAPPYCAGLTRVVSLACVLEFLGKAGRSVMMIGGKEGGLGRKTVIRPLRVSSLPECLIVHTAGASYSEVKGTSTFDT